MSYQRLRFDVSDGLAEITLCRPDAANAIDVVLAGELAEVSLQCSEDAAIRAVLLRAEGPIFCGGGDVASFRGADDFPVLLRRITQGLHVAVSRFARMNAPLVAAVAGTAAGAGMSLACSCDLVIASDNARFTMAYTRIGLVPDGSSTWFLPRRIGLGRARDLMLRNRVLTAADALAWGVIDEVVPAADLDAHARRIARDLAAGPTLAFGETKRLLAQTFDNGLETQMEMEAIGICAMGGTEDSREGVRAFFEKRPAKFRAR
ncbi:MAG TPA: enoyl-CoA hydratase-related protein [Candidatus Binatia bacterium]|jgi:2-(1,2-epoxy-1,2-dihydrophenyl)acetyl-CoA isomerase